MTLGRRDFLAAGLAVPAGASLQEKAPLRVGVLRVRACFERDAYQRVPEVVQELTRVREALAADVEALKRKVDAETRLAEDAKGRPDLQMEKLRRRGQAEGELRALQEAGRKRLVDLAHEFDGRIHREIRRVVALVAAELGLSLVVRADDLRPAAEAPDAADRSPLLFHAAELDITPQVADRLNAEWKKAWTCVPCRRKVTEEKCPDCGARRP